MFDGTSTKTCSKCKMTKPATREYFNICSSRPSGFQCWCNICKKSQRDLKIYAKKERDKIRYLCNPEAFKSKAIKYGKEHPEWRRKTSLINARKFRELHLDILLARQRKHREDNRDTYTAYSELRRSKKRMLLSTLTPQQWGSIKNKFDNKCAYCGCDDKLVQDHFIPVNGGGEYTLNNIIPACASCNSSKSTKSFFEWYPSHKHYSDKRERFILKFMHYTGESQQLSMV